MNKKIAKIILWSNGMVTAFDTKGEQMGTYQGRYKEAVFAINDDRADISETQFFIGSWGIGELPITKEQFFSGGWS